MASHIFRGHVADLLALHSELASLGGVWEDYSVTVRPPEVEVVTPDHIPLDDVAPIIRRHLVRAPLPDDG